MKQFFTLLAIFSLAATASFAQNLSNCPAKTLAIYDTSTVKKYNCQQVPIMAWKDLVSQNIDIKDGRSSTVKSGSLSVRPLSNDTTLGFYKLEISGEIKLGLNECESKGMKVQFFQARKGDVIFVMPAAVRQRVVPKICNKNYTPTFVRTSINVTVTEEIKGVVIENVTEDQRQF